MRILGFIALVAALLFGYAPRLLAGAFEDGIAAYDQGDYATAMKTFRTLAANGNASATYNVGVMYFNGQGVEKDIDQAIVWLEKAADEGSVDSQVRLGVIYVVGRDVPNDYSRALTLFKEAAYQGDPLGQFYLGRMYELGLGTEKDPDSARGWYRVAASQGEPLAKERLGQLPRDAITGGAKESTSEGTDRTALAPATPNTAAIEALPSYNTGTTENEAPPRAEAAVATVKKGEAGPAGPVYRVHLASFRSRDAVDEEWRSLRKRQGDLLAGLDVTSEQIDLGAEKGVFFRLLAGPLPSRDAARRLCEKYREKSPKAWCNPVKVPSE
jgi:hypothetical protein